MFMSDSVIEASLYPKGGHLPPTATKPYAEFQVGKAQRQRAEGRARDWFAVYDEGKELAYVSEEYVPVPVMNTLLVLLTMDEFEDDDDESEDDD